MKKILKITLKSVLIFIITGIVYLNLSLYYHPNFIKINGGTYNEDVYHQLLFLKNELHNSAGEKMQNIYPEGFIFINSLYGLSWCNLIENLDINSGTYKEGINEIKWSFNEINSPKGKSIFNKNLPLEYGTFYKGWSNYLLGRKLMIEKKENRDSNEINLFKKNCHQIATAVGQSNSPYLESYTGQSWPADATIAVASLSLHDKIFGQLYQGTIKKWVAKARKKLDPNTGLIPHSTDPQSGSTIEGARGSSQSLILTFLKKIDIKFSGEQFEIYKKIFLERR
ncbi:MAG TPA: hypothetical protein ENJ95_00945, partial [Bacteroidetes bacterium]|nr:hypothetical protein [Bacteroidota bacterium]